MDIFSSFFLGIMLWWAHLPPTPVIHHTPIQKVEPKEFVIQTTPSPSLGAVQKPFFKKQKNKKLGSVEESLFAEIDENGIVLRVLVISQENIDTGRWGNPANFVKTSTKGTVRKNYAGIGYVYDKIRDAFIPPKGSGTVFNEQKARWEQTTEEIEAMRMVMENQKQIKAISQ